jgi:hypothetical protein
METVTMKRDRFNSLLGTAVLSSAIAVGFVASTPAAQASEHRDCSNATLRGSFGFTSTGTLITTPAPFAGPYAEVGRQTFDGHGNTAATANISANGNIVGVTLQGTYTVDPDCTGSMTLAVSPLDLTVSLYFVIDSNGAQLRAIHTDPGVVESGIFNKQFRGSHEEE